jgi:hypothetical protein
MGVELAERLAERRFSTLLGPVLPGQKACALASRLGVGLDTSRLDLLIVLEVLERLGFL